jgi:hypothetical protein
MTKTTKTINNKIKLKVIIFKLSPKYYNGVLVVSTFYFAHFPNTYFLTYAPLAVSEQYVAYMPNAFQADLFS